MKNFRLHPLFILYLIFLVIMGQIPSIATYILVVAIHEFSHNFVAQKLGYKLDRLTLMPYGVCLNYKTNVFTIQDEILIALAGPLVNCFITVFCIALWWLFPVLMPFTYVFCLCNAVLFIFNLLPCYPLDGGRILAGYLTRKYDRKLAIKVAILFNLIVSFVLIFTFITGLFFGVINTNLLIISAFLLISNLEPQKSTSYNYISIRTNTVQSRINKGKQIKFTLINSDEKIYKIIAKMSRYKFNIFYVIFPNNKIKIITEIALKNLALKYRPTYALDEIPEMFI